MIKWTATIVCEGCGKEKELEFTDRVWWGWSIFEAPQDSGLVHIHTEIEYVHPEGWLGVSTCSPECHEAKWDRISQETRESERSQG